MACVCKKCQNKRVPCDEEYCNQCLIDKCNARKNIDAGGNFYGEELTKESET